MLKFLQQAKTHLVSLPATCSVHAVLANEACDLDSAAATLVTAYMLASAQPDRLVLPVLNIAEDQYPLKTEVAFFLHELGIDKEHLIFRPSVDLAALHRDGRLHMTLVDRHRLEEADALLATAVVRVIDHHRPDRPLSDDVTIELVGSCCTLVAERLFSVSRALIDCTVADLLMGTILLDTVNLSVEAQRVTPKDRLMVSFLEPLSSGQGQNQMFNMLQKAKGDISNLSSFQLLNKDQKMLEGGGLRLVFSSVPMMAKEFVRAPDAVSACNQLCQTSGRDLLVVMGSHVTDTEFCRDIAVFSARDDLRLKVCQILEEATSPCLALSRQPFPHARISLYAQGNAAASRKVVLPLIKAQLSVAGDSGDLSPIPRLPRAPPSVTYTGPRVELPPEVRPPNGVDLNLSSYAFTLLEPTSGAGSSSQSSAQNSVPYTPQNSVADSDSISDVTLPSFNSRELLQRIELRRGPLGGFEGADDVSAYPFTPKNSFVESSILENAYRHMNLSELDSDMILQKVREKKRKSNMFDDITEEEDGRGTVRDVEAAQLGAHGGEDRNSGRQSSRQRKSRPNGSLRAELGEMRTDRGPGPSSPDPPLIPAAANKAGSQGSLNEQATSPPAPAPQPAPRTGGQDGGFMSDPDDDTTTFKSALSSSEAIRRKGNADINEAAPNTNNDATEIPVSTPFSCERPVPATNLSPGGDAAKLWRLSHGGTPKDMAENGLASAGNSRAHVIEPRLPSTSDFNTPDSLTQINSGPESLSYGASGPESLNTTEDDYYEDFTMPGTHESVMSRQMSFRRRVRATPVSVPDADRIEGVVRAGELERHGSIRRRMVAPPTPSVSNNSGATSGSPGRFGRDLREIEELMAEDGDEVPVDGLPSLGPMLGSSTPKTEDQPPSLIPQGEEPISMEASTVMKVKDCLDKEKVRDIYKISGRLQDILTQEDIQEILAHQEMYAELLGEEILMELKSSMSESRQSTPPRSVPGQEARPSSADVRAKSSGEALPLEDIPLSTEEPRSTHLEFTDSPRSLTTTDPYEPLDADDSLKPEPSVLPPEASDEDVHLNSLAAAPLTESVPDDSTKPATFTAPPEAPPSGGPVPPVLHTRIDLDSSPDATPTGSPPNSITVRVEINHAAQTSTPVPSPRSRIPVAADIASDPDIPHFSDAGSSAGPPSPLPPSAHVQPHGERADTPEGRLWRTGSLRRLPIRGGSLEALFAESDTPLKPGQRRIAAPSISISLDDSERNTDTPGADSLEGDDMGITTPGLGSKPTDADSGVSDGTLAEHSGDDGGEEALTPAQNLERPSSLGQHRRRKISVPSDVLGGDGGDGDSLSFSRLDSDQATPTEALASSDLLDTLTPDDIDTPDELEESILERLPPAEPIPEYSARDELQNERSWRTCVVAGLQRRIDMKVIEPYKKVLSHGGYLGHEAEQAIIVFSACYLPDRSRRDYSYVMDNLFLYVLTTLDALIADDYVLIYLHGATQRSCMPAFGWLKRCYQMVDRRLRKNLQGLYLVHPTFWVKTIVALTRPFISSKFSRKLRFVAGLRELSQLVPMDHVCIPDRVKQLDFQLMISERKKQLGIR